MNWLMNMFSTLSESVMGDEPVFERDRKKGRRARRERSRTETPARVRKRRDVRAAVLMDCPSKLHMREVAGPAGPKARRVGAVVGLRAHLLPARADSPLARAPAEGRGGCVRRGA